MYHPLNEVFIGEDVFYFQQRAGNLITTRGSPLFGKGWLYEKTDSWSTTGWIATLNLPLFFKEKEDLEMRMRIETAGDEKDAWIDFYVNGEFLRSKKVPPDGGWVSLKLGKGKYRSAVNELEFHLYRKRNEGRNYRLMLHDLKFEPASESEDEDADS
jgi:hypothetical protein